jgi:hypothetical protein
VSFALSTLRTSTRDWVDVWVSPYDDHLQLPLQDWLPDLNGPPRNAVHVFLDQDGHFRVVVYDDFDAVELELASWEGYETFLTPDARRRDTFELHLSDDHIRFGMPDHDHWWVDTPIPSLGWTQGVVQLGHHSYTPTKDCPDGRCRPGTWHWDDVVIEPAVPFTMIGADRRHADGGTGGAIRFAAPAPDRAHLRFAGIGDDLAVSYDRGRTWRPAELQRQHQDPVDEAFRSYWMPLPAGTSEVHFRGGDWWGGPWMVRDASIWAPGGHGATAQVAPTPAGPGSHHHGASPQEVRPACLRPGHWAAGGWAAFVRRMCGTG